MSLVVVVRKCVHGTYKVKAKFSFSVFGVIEFPLKMENKNVVPVAPVSKGRAGFFCESPFL